MADPLLCPACLQFQVQTPAVTQVEGTLYCAGHGIEALQTSPRRGGRYLPATPPQQVQPAPPAGQPVAPSDTSAQAPSTNSTAR